MIDCSFGMGYFAARFEPKSGWDKEIKNLIELNRRLLSQHNKRFKPRLKLSDLDFKRKTKDQTALRLAQINGEIWVKIKERKKHNGKRKIEFQSLFEGRCIL